MSSHKSTATRCAIKARVADPESLVRFAELLKLRSLAASTQFGYMKVLRLLAGRFKGDPAGLDGSAQWGHGRPNGVTACFVSCALALPAAEQRRFITDACGADVAMEAAIDREMLTGGDDEAPDWRSQSDAKIASRVTCLAAATSRRMPLSVPTRRGL